MTLSEGLPPTQRLAVHLNFQEVLKISSCFVELF
jgi:hypothetical protein